VIFKHACFDMECALFLIYIYIYIYIKYNIMNVSNLML
jgi:hypothetical protein